MKSHIEERQAGNRTGKTLCGRAGRFTWNGESCESCGRVQRARDAKAQRERDAAARGEKMSKTTIDELTDELTDEQIETLRAEAAGAGDLAQVAICDRARGGDTVARRLCAVGIAYERRISLASDGAERNALQAFAWEHGRRWKQALRDEWTRACANVPDTISGFEYRSVLQRLRNSPEFGPAGLKRYRLPVGFAFKRRDS